MSNKGSRKKKSSKYVISRSLPSKKPRSPIPKSPKLLPKKKRSPAKRQTHYQHRLMAIWTTPNKGNIKITFVRKID